MSKELADEDIDTIVAGFRALRYLLDISEELQTMNDFMCEVMVEIRELKEELRAAKGNHEKTNIVTTNFDTNSGLF